MNLTRLEEQDVGIIRYDECLANHCTYAIGGPAAALIEPSSVAQLMQLRCLIHSMKLPWTVLGGGSNLLCPDEGFPGIVIKLGAAMSQMHLTGSKVTVQAGLSAARLATGTAIAGLDGLSHIVGIPGTLGGLIAMNGGSNGHSISEYLTQIETVNETGQHRIWTTGESRFGYRSSRFQTTNEIISGAIFILPDGQRQHLIETFRSVLRKRRSKFPLGQPNCGSVFMSTPEIYDTFGPPGKVIEDTDLKGVRCGDAEVSRCHANFIVNTGRATAAQVIALVSRVRHAVYQRTGLKMPCELRYLFPDGSIRPLHELLETSDHVD